MHYLKSEKQLEYLLQIGLEHQASDIHLKQDYFPTYRVQGNFRAHETTKKIPKTFIEDCLEIILDKKQLEKYHQQKGIDVSYVINYNGEDRRLRVNIAQDNNGHYITLRIIPSNIKDLSEIAIPELVKDKIITLKKGLLLVTGITGSGKSTTLASIIQEINHRRSEHIITLEDPIEYIHHPQKSIISQREIGKNVLSYQEGVKDSLRQDPDIILIGEIRDKETAKNALEAAETGHLVLSTLHTKNTSETVARYVNLFPNEEQEHIRNSLAAALTYIITQQLIPYNQIHGRSLALEIMNIYESNAIQNLLRRGEDHKLEQQIETSKKMGMQLMDSSIEELIKMRKIGLEEGLRYAKDPENLKNNLQNQITKF